MSETTEVFRLASKIAADIYQDDKELLKYEVLRDLLLAFADEIKRSAIEP